jgi:ESF2/ABP1 family protein
MAPWQVLAARLASCASKRKLIFKMVKRKRKEASDDARFVLPEVAAVDEEAAEASRAGNKLLRKKKKRGVVYVARVPAYMKPAKLRYMLEQHGEVTNMYLTQEDERVRLRRKRAGGSKKPKFTEAWFEFKDRKVAKLVARSLNNTKLGAAAGSKSSFWHDNLWNIKYLSKFTWEHLT